MRRSVQDGLSVSDLMQLIRKHKTLAGRISELQIINKSSLVQGGWITEDHHLLTQGKFHIASIPRLFTLANPLIAGWGC